MSLQKKELLQIIRELCDYYGKPQPEVSTLQLWYDALQEYPAEAVREAMAKHIKSPQGKFWPTAASLLDQLKPAISVQDLLTDARDPKTVTGYLVRRCVGHYDLDINPKAAEQKARDYLESGKLKKDLQRIYAGHCTMVEAGHLAAFAITDNLKDKERLQALPAPVVYGGRQSGKQLALEKIKERLQASKES